MEQKLRIRFKNGNIEMFKNRMHITTTFAKRGKTLEAKRKIVEMANSPLFYIFGYNLTRKDKCEE
jgi:hypothetical protein